MASDIVATGHSILAPLDDVDITLLFQAVLPTDVGAAGLKTDDQLSASACWWQ